MKHLCGVALVALLAGVASSIIGCKGKEGPVGPTVTGNLTGFVEMANEYGTELSTFAGVTVAIEGTSHQAVSDVDGKWLISDLPMGTYNLVFAKAGFGTCRKYAFEVAGEGTAYAGKAYLSQMPSFTITTAQADSVDTATVRISCTVTPMGLQNKKRGVAVFIGTDSSVASDPSTHQGFAGTKIDASWDNFWWHVPWRLSIGQKTSGTQLYMVVYASSYPYYYSSYTDPSTGKTVYPCLSVASSNVVQFTVP
jgi:hypothetical protein